MCTPGSAPGWITALAYREPSADSHSRGTGSQRCWGAS